MPIEDYNFISILYYRSQYELVRYELASFLIHCPSNSPHIFTSYQTSGTPAPKRTKEISCFTCLNLLIQNRFFFFFNIHPCVIIIRSSIGNNLNKPLALSVNSHIQLLHLQGNYHWHCHCLGLGDLGPPIRVLMPFPYIATII